MTHGDHTSAVQAERPEIPLGHAIPSRTVLGRWTRSGRESRCAQLISNPGWTGEADERIIERHSLPEQEYENGCGRLDNHAAVLCRRRQHPALIDVVGSELHAAGQRGCATEGDLSREQILDNLGHSQHGEVAVDLARRAGSQFRIPPMYGSLERLAPNPEPHALGWTAKRPAGTIAIGSRNRGHELVGCVEIPRVTFIVSRWRRELFDDRLAGTNDCFGPTKDAAVMADEICNCPSRAMHNGGIWRRTEDAR